MCTCKVLSVVQSAVQAAVDIALLVIPLPILLSVKISGQKKIGLLIVYAVGFISFGATITRLVQAVNLFINGASDVFLEARALFVMFSVWNALEVNTAIICANLPAFVPLIRNRSLKPTSTTSKPSAYHYGSTGKSGSHFKSANSSATRSTPGSLEKSAIDYGDDGIHLTTDINVKFDKNMI